MDADVIVVGAGLAGLVATAELAAAGRRVLLLDQENAANLGGQAYWSFGGLFLVDSPEQRRMGVRDSPRPRLAGLGGHAPASTARGRTAGRGGGPRAYVEFAAGEKRAWLHGLGRAVLPGGRLGRARRLRARPGHGNSVPRFHITWGTGPGVLEPFVRRVRAAVDAGLVQLALPPPGGRPDDDRRRGRRRARHGARAQLRRARRAVLAHVGRAVRAAHAGAVVVTSGGIGGNPELVRRHWPARLGTPPEHLLTGVPAYVDGRDARDRRGRRRQRSSTATGCGTTPRASRTTRPSGPATASGSCPGPSSLWLDATGRRLPVPLFPGFDTLGTLRAPAPHRARPHLVRPHPAHHREGVRPLRLRAEPGPDRQGPAPARPAAAARARPAPVEAFKERGADFVVAGTLAELVAGMNALTPRAAARPGAGRARGRGPRPGDGQPVHQGPAGRRAAPGPRPTAATGSSGWPRRTGCSTPRPGR